MGLHLGAELPAALGRVQVLRDPRHIRLPGSERKQKVSRHQTLGWGGAHTHPQMDSLSRVIPAVGKESAGNALRRKAEGCVYEK